MEFPLAWLWAPTSKFNVLTKMPMGLDRREGCRARGRQMGVVRGCGSKEGVAGVQQQRGRRGGNRPEQLAPNLDISNCIK